MSICDAVRAQFSEYLDGSVPGNEMQAISRHLESCDGCHGEFEGLRAMQRGLASLRSVKPPSDLALRLRVTISQEIARTPIRRLERLQMQWENSIAPFLVQASAGFASAVLLLGVVALLIGTFAPEPVSASDEPIGMRTSPHFLYTSAQPDGNATNLDNVVVEAFVDRSGRVYKYRIVTGQNDVCLRSKVQNMLLFSVFEPARVFGQPVPSRAILSFAGVAVRG